MKIPSYKESFTPSIAETPEDVHESPSGVFHAGPAIQKKMVACFLPIAIPFALPASNSVLRFFPPDGELLTPGLTLRLALYSKYL